MMKSRNASSHMDIDKLSFCLLDCIVMPRL